MPAYTDDLLAVIAAPDAASKAAALATVRLPADGADWPLPSLPARPGRPEHWREGEPARRRRGLDHAHSRLRFLHAIHHIELSAIDLACLAGLRGSGAPAALHVDMLGIAREEAEHAALVEALLVQRGYPPGSEPVHHRLWDSALGCADLGEHLAAVPRVLEARGLDVAAAVLPRLAAVDAQAHAVIARIYRDEIGHVGLGTRWHDWWCARHGVDRTVHLLAVARRLFPDLPGPFALDLPGRLAAGFTNAELTAIATPGDASAGGGGNVDPG